MFPTFLPPPILKYLIYFFPTPFIWQFQSSSSFHIYSFGIIDANEADKRQDGFQDDDNEEINHMLFEDDNNRLAGPEEDLESEDDEHIQEQLLAHQSLKKAG